MKKASDGYWILAVFYILGIIWAWEMAPQIYTSLCQDPVEHAYARGADNTRQRMNLWLEQDVLPFVNSQLEGKVLRLIVGEDSQVIEVGYLFPIGGQPVGLSGNLGTPFQFDGPVFVE